MTDHITAAVDDRLFAVAARWQLRLQDPSATPAEHDAFLAWVTRDPTHLVAFEEAERLWQITSPPPQARNEAAIARLLAEARPARGRRVAALVGALVLLLGLMQGPEAYDSLRADHITWTGGRDRIALADGTRVELNSGTALAVDLEGDRRQVRLFRGEAFFDVAPDAARPFIVSLPQGDIRVTGTRFNVDLSHGEGDVALFEGAVTLSGRGTEAELRPGERARINAAGIGPRESFDPDHVHAWREGRMVFYRTPLREVLAELGRYRRGTVSLLNGAAADLQVTGVFSTSDTDAAFDIIAETLGLSVHRLTGALVILR